MDKGVKVDYRTGSIKKKRFNILIVDDDLRVAHALKEYMELRGHQVFAVDEGVRGISSFTDNHYDLIFLDYHLDADGSLISNDRKKNLDNSHMDGSVLTECIKEIDNNKIRLIFAYTGDTSKKAIDKFKKVGMDGVIFKPIEEHVLNRFMTSLETRLDIDKSFLGNLIKQYRNSIILF